MGGANKKMKEKLIQTYGGGCFFDRARVAERIERMGGIRTFKSFVTEKKFKGKSISYQLTVHHLVHRSAGGRTEEQNCANVSEIAHQYIHSLPFQQEQIVNDMLREFKMNCVTMKGDGTTLDASSITLDFEGLRQAPPHEVITIPVYDNENKKEKNRSAKLEKHRNPTRAMKKRELQELIREEEDYEIDF